MGPARPPHRPDRRPADRRPVATRPRRSGGASPATRSRSSSPVRCRARPRPRALAGFGDVADRRPGPPGVGLRRPRGPSDDGHPDELPGLDDLARTVAGRRDHRRGRRPRGPGHRPGPGGRRRRPRSSRTATCCASSPRAGSGCRPTSGGAVRARDRDRLGPRLGARAPGHRDAGTRPATSPDEGSGRRATRRPPRSSSPASPGHAAAAAGSRPWSRRRPPACRPGTGGRHRTRRRRRPRPRATGPIEGLDQPLVAEPLAVGGLRVGDPVGIEQDEVARLERDRALGQIEPSNAPRSGPDASSQIGPSSAGRTSSGGSWPAFASRRIPARISTWRTAR